MAAEGKGKYGAVAMDTNRIEEQEEFARANEIEDEDREGREGAIELALIPLCQALDGSDMRGSRRGGDSGGIIDKTDKLLN